MNTQKSAVQAYLKAGITQAKKLTQKHQVLKLHVGCGTTYKDGWINIDNNSDNNIQKLDLDWNLLYPLPFASGSVDYIFNEHFLEHLSADEGQRVLKDFLRVLKVGGKLRIAMPDLANCVAAYHNKTFLTDSKDFLEKYGLGFVKTNAEMLNINMRAWGHRWLYDWEELERRLHDAGYEEVIKCSLGQSQHADFVNMETRNESTLIAEVTKI